jgi:hypothetical protein
LILAARDRNVDTSVARSIPPSGYHEISAPGKFAVAGEGLTIGRDGGEPVTEDFPGPHPYEFTGGTINRVAVDVSGEPYVDLEREAAAMLARE